MGSLSMDESLVNVVELAARIMLCAVFLYAGISKRGDGYGRAAAEMSSYGVSARLLPLVVATEVLCPIAIGLGWGTRIAAFLLAGYSALAAVIFHHDLTSAAHRQMFFLDLALVGGLLLLTIHGAGSFSLDAHLGAVR